MKSNDTLKEMKKAPKKTAKEKRLAKADKKNKRQASAHPTSLLMSQSACPMCEMKDILAHADKYES